MNGLDMEVVPMDRAKRVLEELGSRGRESRYQPVAETWKKSNEGEAILLEGLDNNDIQNIRNLLYRRFGKESVIVRSSEQDDGTYKAAIRERENGEYLRD